MITREQFQRAINDPLVYVLAALFAFCSALMPGHVDWLTYVLLVLGGFNLGTAVSKWS